MKKILIVGLLAAVLLSACGGAQVADGPEVTINKPPT